MKKGPERCFGSIAVLEAPSGRAGHGKLVNFERGNENSWPAQELGRERPVDRNWRTQGR